MKVLVLYRPNSEYARVVEEFIRNFEARTDGSHRLEVLNLDSRDGNAIAMLYDVMQYPAVLVLQGDGSLQKSWEGGTMPLIDEVVAYSRA